MHVLITYDVSTTDDSGKRRLRHVARACCDWGQRVQNSVFECKLDPGQYVKLKARLGTLIDPEVDSVRFYHLGKHWHGRVEHLGRDRASDPDAPLIA
ncbi:MAG: CRISPR-associated endonuclease Cas2 [Phycisphaerales bacterium]|nr:CRISPR-associated endonuclease Cas2 [Phycisphaerales bacterium]